MKYVTIRGASDIISDLTPYVFGNDPKLACIPTDLDFSEKEPIAARTVFLSDVFIPRSRIPGVGLRAILRLRVR